MDHSPLAPGASGTAFGEAAVWVLNHLEGTVTHIDPETNSVVAIIDVGKGASAIAVGEGSVWVTGNRCLRPRQRSAVAFIRPDR